MDLGERLRVKGPDFGYWHVSGGHAGDEYGNCTLYFQCPLFGIIWWYPTGHYQTEVELPDPGCDPWIDKVYYDGCDEYCHHGVAE